MSLLGIEGASLKGSVIHKQGGWGVCTWGPTPDLSQHLSQGYWLEIDLTCMFLMVGETRAPGGNPRKHEENMQTPFRKVLPQPDMEPRTFLPWGDSANHWPTMPRCQWIEFSICIFHSVICISDNYPSYWYRGCRKKDCFCELEIRHFEKNGSQSKTLEHRTYNNTDIRTGGAFRKPIILHSRPPHAGINQPCEGETVDRIWTSLSSCLHAGISVTFQGYKQGRHCECLPRETT